MTANPRPLIEQLLDSRDDVDIMVAARELAPRIDLASHTARLLVDLLNSGSDSRAAASAFILGEWGHHALDASPNLLTSLRRQTSHANVTVRHWCVSALMRLGAHASSAVPELAVCLRDVDDGVRTVSLHAIGELGPIAGVVLPCVLDAIYDNNDEVRQAALAALVRIDPRGEKSLDELCIGLASTSPRTRQSTINALGRLGAIARPAAAAVCKCVRDENVSVREAAIHAVQCILPAEHALLHVLAMAMHDENEDVRTEAVRGFNRFQHDAGDAAPYVISALRDPSPRIRFDALEILEQMTPNLGLLIAAARIAIENCLRDESPLVHTRAVQASGRIAEWTQQMDPPFINALDASDDASRPDAAQVITNCAEAV